MDFVLGLPGSRQGFDTIWVIVDILSKFAHFLPTMTTDFFGAKSRLYIKWRPIIYYLRQSSQIYISLLTKFTEGYGTRVSLSTAFHAHTDGMSERIVLTHGDMLLACILNFKGNWSDHLPLTEYAYNKSYQSSIGMAPCEALYDRLCKSPMLGRSSREERSWTRLY